MSARLLTEAERQAAAELAAELSEHRLVVELVPAPEPKHAEHCVRMVMDANPTWYQRLCASVEAQRRRPRQRRRPDTGIRRRRIERALERLSSGVCRFANDWRVLPIVERAAASLERAAS